MVGPKQPGRRWAFLLGVKVAATVVRTIEPFRLSNAKRPERNDPRTLLIALRRFTCKVCAHQYTSSTLKKGPCRCKRLLCLPSSNRAPTTVGGGRERSISPSKLRSASPSRKAKVPVPHAHAAAPGGNHHHKPRSRGISPSKTIRSRRAGPDRTRSSSYSSGEDSFSNLSSDEGGCGPQHHHHPSITKPRHPQKRNSFTSLNGSEISARMKQRSSFNNGDGGRVKPARSSSSGSADHEGGGGTGGTTHSGRTRRSSLRRSFGDLSKTDSGSSRLGAASQFLRNTHRKLKDGIAEKQDKISELRDEIASTQVEIAFL